MPAEHVARGLARIAAKGVRTANRKTIGGVSVVATKAIPEGVVAMMLPDRIEAVRTATGTVVATVALDATPAGDAAFAVTAEGDATGSFKPVRP
jgi:hypothetical protein